MPPRRTDPVSTGLNGSDTSYCFSSPVPKHETYRNRSSSDRLMSVTSGGTALKPLSNGGRSSADAPSAGISITFLTCQAASLPEPSRNQTQIDEERSFRLVTTPANLYVSLGLCAGLSSST